MIAPEMPSNEKDRQAAVERYDILDTLPEVNYDSITSLMSKISGAPVSLITMLDRNRNYLKSHHGVPFDESPREISFCGHAINSDARITVIEDALEDERFFDNPLVTEAGVRFYAGVPLVTPDDYRLGTLCLFDMKARKLDEDLKSVLIDMASQVETLLEFRHQNKLLINIRQQLEWRNKELENFAHIVTHDIKTPLIGTAYIAEALVDDHSDEMPKDALAAVDKILTSVSSVASYIDGILEYYTSEQVFTNGSEPVDLRLLIDDVKELTADIKNAEWTVAESCTDKIIEVNKGSLLQILNNLVTNSIKYCAKDIVKINIDFKETTKHYEFSISDNGIGIKENQIGKMFDLFTKGDHDGITGTGVGLATVKKLVNHAGGEISISSTAGKSTTAIFTLAKGNLNSA